MMIAIYGIFVGAGALILLHQRNIDRAEKINEKYDIHSQIGLDRKMLAITVAGLVVVYAVLLPL